MSNATSTTAAPATASSESDPGSYSLFSESVDLLSLLVGNGVYKASSVQLRRMLLLTAPDNTEGAAASNDSDADAGNMRLAPGGPSGPAGPSGRQRITCRTTYLYHPEKADWMGARDLCEYDGGQLAVITNPIAQRRIAST